MSTKRTQAAFYLLIVNLIYAANFSIAKMVMPAYIPAFGFIFLRVSAAVILFWLTTLIATTSPPFIARHDYTRIALCGLFGIAINQLCFFKGLSYTTPINGSLIMTTTPILVLTVSYLLLGEQVTKQKIFGILLGIFGALWLIYFGNKNTPTLATTANTSTGDLLIFINAVSYAIYLVMVKPLIMRYNPIHITTWVTTVGWFFVLPFGWSEFVAIPWHSFTPFVYACTAYILVFTTFLAYLLNSLALRQVSPAVSSIFIYVQPVLTTLIAWLLGNDQLNLSKIIAAAFIFTGVFLVTREALETAKRNTAK
jgi:drug/metabolite transporter (DMT)-like permease